MKLPDIEVVAAKVHNNWVRRNLSKGIKSLGSQTGEELMVAYDKLSEEAKDWDRGHVRVVYAAIMDLK